MSALLHPRDPGALSEQLLTASEFAGQAVATSTAGDAQARQIAGMQHERECLRDAVRMLCGDLGTALARASELAQWLRWAIKKLRGLGFPPSELQACDVVLARAAAA